MIADLLESHALLKPKSILRNVSEYFSMALGGHFISDFIYIKRPVTVLGNVNVG